MLQATLKQTMEKEAEVKGELALLQNRLATEKVATAHQRVMEMEAKLRVAAF